MDREISEDFGADSGANPGTADGTDSIHTVMHGLVTQSGNRGKLYFLFFFYMNFSIFIRLSFT